MHKSPGPLIMDLHGLEVDAEERELLKHPLIGGVILFSRNYQSPDQISALTQAIRQLRPGPFIIAVDHEGGRVQRFRQGFTQLPAMRKIGQLYDHNQSFALNLAETCGWLAAAELFSVGVNLTFAPVLDLDRENQSAIGDRAFHADPEKVTVLAKAFIAGLREMGMTAVGKHFPGHGGVKPDSHKTMPVDLRTYEEIESHDLLPFTKLIQDHFLNAIMPAHILFSKVNNHPVGFSKYWLQTVLRDKLRFNGVIFSDDLNMEGAATVGDYATRAKFALEAGCDCILLCNNRCGVIQVLDHLVPEQYLLLPDKVNILLGQPALVSDYVSLVNSSLWKKKNESVRQFNEEVEIH